MSKEKCEECKWWAEIDKTITIPAITVPAGRCHRMPQKEFTNKDDYCGEFKADDND